MKSLIILLVIFFQKCSGYDLDDVEYDKMPPLFSLDNYDRCLLYNGTYCVVRTDLYAEPENELMNMMINYTKSSTIKHYNYTYQNKGICVTTTCRDFIGDKNLGSHSEIHDVLEKCENHSLYETYGIQARVSKDFYCDTKETKYDKKDLVDWSVLAVVLFIIFFNLAATLYDAKVIGNSKKILNYGEKILVCFSIKRNFAYLVAPPSTDPEIAKLEGINFIRTSASFMMTMGHVIWIFTMGFIDNPHDFERSYDQVHIQLIYNGMTVVQVFFVVSGFLLVYNLEKSTKENRITLKMVPMILFRRLIRLAPPLALVVAFNATWVRFLGSGALWKRYVHSMVHDCRTWWWSHILFINNYFTDNAYCTIQTWHTAADTHLFILAITLYVLVKPHARSLVVSLFFVLSMVLPALHVYFYDLNAQFIKTPEMLRSLIDPNRNPYVFTHNNISGFLLGMITAYKVHQWQKQGYVFKGIIPRFVVKMFLPIFVLSFFGGNFFHEEDYRSPLWVRILYQATHRLIVAFPIVCCLVSLVLNMDNGINAMMKWRFFKVTGKLTYSVFLLHEFFTHLVAGSKSNLEHFSYLNLLIYQFGINAITYLISLPFYLMVEAPMDPLIKLLVIKSKTNATEITNTSKSFVSEILEAKRRRVKGTEHGKEAVQVTGDPQTDDAKKTS